MSDPIDTAITAAHRADRRPDALTESGKRYLRHALDPYHDFNVGNVGVPTLNSGATYCRNVRLARTITYPDAASPTDAWDLHIFTTPVFCQQAAGVLNSDLHGSGTVADPYAVKNQVGGFALTQISHVCYAWAPSGSPLGILDDTAIWAALPIGSPDWGAYRVVSSGFEVHNITPELYVGGSVTTWRSNPQIELTNTVLSGTPTRSAVSRSYQGIPATLSLANQMTTSRTWEAKAGAYVVSAPDYDDLAFKTYDEGAIIIRTGAESAPGSTRRSVVVGGFIASSAAGTSPVVYRSGITPAGAVFTGLSRETILRLDCRVLVEVSPDFSTNDLSLAGQPVTPDPVALELAALAFSRLPSGVPVGANAAGDWFRAVIRTIGQVAPLVAGIVPHPVVQRVAGVVGTVAGAANRILDARQRMLPAAKQVKAAVGTPRAAARPKTTPAPNKRAANRRRKAT